MTASKAHVLVVRELLLITIRPWLSTQYNLLEHVVKA